MNRYMMAGIIASNENRVMKADSMILSLNNGKVPYCLSRGSGRFVHMSDMMLRYCLPGHVPH